MSPERETARDRTLAYYEAEVAVLRSECSMLRETREEAYRVLDAIEAMLVKKKRMGTLFDVQQIRAGEVEST